jgi:hypothetical protein
MENYMNKFFTFLAELNGWYLMLFGFLLTLILFYIVPIEEQIQYRRSVATVLYFGLMYLVSPYFFYNRLELSRLQYARNYLFRKTFNHNLNLAITDTHFSAKINSGISLSKKAWGYVYASSRVIFFTFGGIVTAHIPVGLITNFGKVPFDLAVKNLLNF